LSKSLETIFIKARSARARGETDEARALFQAVLARYPGNLRAQRGLAALDQGAAGAPPGRAATIAGLTRAHLDELTELVRVGEAEAVIARAGALLAQYPRAFPLHSFIGEGQALLKRYDLAAAAYERAARLNASDGRIQARLGYFLQKCRRFRESVAAFVKALDLEPANHLTWSSMGQAQLDLKRTAQAEESFRKALAIEPDHLSSLTGLSRALIERGKLEEAESLARAYLRDNPRSADMLSCLGSALMLRGSLDEAKTVFDQALALQPDLASCLCNLGMLHLARGNFAEGWKGYDYRATRESVPEAYNCPGPLWDGKEDLAGKSILLYWEQGLGDSIQFFRYALALRDLGARVTVMVQDVLLPLLGSGGHDVDVICEVPQDRVFDRYGLLMSMPHAMGTGAATIPAPIPYLTADPQRVARWARHFGDHGFRVGISWHGSNHAESDLRSFGVDHFAPLARIPGVRLISLNKGAGDEQLAGLPEGVTIETAGSDFDPPGAAFLDTAAIMRHCDLVVSCDTSVAHVAGALGVPVWLALHDQPEWRWLRGRDDSDWYPTMRLFRQERRGDWSSVFRKMAAALEAHPERRRAEQTWSAA